MLDGGEAGHGKPNQDQGDEKAVPGWPLRVWGGLGLRRRIQVLLPSIFFQLRRDRIIESRRSLPVGRRFGAGAGKIRSFHLKAMLSL
jgi:hypothetical protein